MIGLAVDFHFHAPVKEFLDFLGEFKEPALKYFNTKLELKNLGTELDVLSSFGVKNFVVLPIDATTFLGRRIPNSAILSIKDDRVIKFVSVDPLRQDSREQLEALIREEPAGLKLHPQLQGFHPLDKRAIRLYSVCERHGLPIVFHTGTSGIGAGVKSKIRLDNGRPIYFDEIAVNFPDLKIVLAHFGWPWTEEALAIAQHKPNVFLDLSGWSPKYIPQQVWAYAKRLKDKLLFGSDFPLIRPERWIEEFKSVDVPSDIKDKILKNNAIRLLKL